MAASRQTTLHFTLIELLLVIALVVLLAGLLLPLLNASRKRARVVRTVVELRSIMQGVELYSAENNEEPPVYLSDVFREQLIDPWGNAYIYSHFSTIPKGHQRKDRNLVPINTVFDLYSKGADGQTASPLTASESRDDVIVADDGDYIGLAENY